MFDFLKDEKSDWDKYFDYFLNRYEEEVGYAAQIFTKEELLVEIDGAIGENSNILRGLRFMLYSIEEEDEESVEKDEEPVEKDEEPVEKDEEPVDEECDDADDEAEEEEGPAYSVTVQDLVHEPDVKTLDDDKTQEIFASFEFTNPGYEDAPITQIEIYCNKERDTILAAKEVGETTNYYLPKKI